MLGVSNIRQFEERELRSQQERAKKRLEFENQKFRLQNQIEFERSRDTIANVRKWEAAFKNDEKELEKVKNDEARHMKIIEEAMDQQEKAKRQRITLKSQVDDFETEISEIKKRLNNQQKEMLTPRNRSPWWRPSWSRSEPTDTVCSKHARWMTSGCR